MSSRASTTANRLTLWIVVLIGFALFAGSILFIVSRAH
jgi:hypothetical protein